MREYGQVQSAIWRHPDFVSLSHDAKLLIMYSLTGPHSNGCGCFYLPQGYICADLDMVCDRVSDTLNEVAEKGFLRVCENTNYVFIPKFLKWNIITSPKVCVNRLKDVQAIPSRFTYLPELKADFDKYCKFKSANYAAVWDTLLNTLSNTLCDITPHPTPPEKKEKKENIKRKKTKFTRSTFQPEWVVEARGKPKYENLDLETEREQFCLHHEMKGTGFTDWKLAWWYWLNNAIKFQKGGKVNVDWRDDIRKLTEEAIRMGGQA